MNQSQNQSLDRTRESVFRERKLAQQALKNGESESAWTHLKQALKMLDEFGDIPGCDALLVSTTLEFSNLCFAQGRGFADAAPYLQKAKLVSEQTGDRRSRALIFMHLARSFYFAQRRNEALALFAEGKREVEELGDEDILNRSAEFLGFYFHIQGLFLDALPHFERAAKLYEAEGKGAVINPSGPLWLAYCHFYLGHIHQAIGTLDYYRRLAIERSDRSLATTLRSVIGLVLLIIDKKEEAIQHLNGAIQEAEKTNNALAYHFARGNMSYLKLLEGHPQESWDLLSKTMEYGKKTGLTRQYASPHCLEQLFELNRLGLEPVTGLNYEEEIERQLQEPNIHLRGTAHRLRAMDGMIKGRDHHSIEAELKTSEEFIKRSGDPIQLAKTRLELARLKLKEDDLEKARFYAKKAWHGFSGYGDHFFPDNLRYLLAVNEPDQANQDLSEELTEKFVAMIQDLVPSADLYVLMVRTVAATNRFFGAERGGLFWFSKKKRGKDFIFRAGYNLSEKEVRSDDFKSNLELVFMAYRKNQPYIARVEGEGHYWPHKVRAILCLPVELEGRTRGVLYHDNAYVKDCFDFIQKPMLTRLGNSLSAYIERVYNFSQQLKRSTMETVHQADYPDRYNIIAESKPMKKILDQADRVAPSDGTVLILGETGVGKELLAHRIHHKSQRSGGPFITVDLTTMPENLVDSELFGHEKGAFTGADRQKAGRLELAHGGTLFIDEIGEIPKSIQVKLLRVLQDKTLIRLGATQTISSDFRLIVATNRNLTAEVAEGRFREDLYYRLNVVPLTLPPLRDRIEDVPLLARHFINKYSTKYSRPLLELSSDDEAGLMDYRWPGNIRELQNIIERTILLSDGESLELELPAERNTDTASFYKDHPSLEELQRRYIVYAIEKSGGKIGGQDGAAEFLGLKRTTLQKRMAKYRLS